MKYIVALVMLSLTTSGALAQEDKISIPLRMWKNEEERVKEQQQVQRWETNWDEYISQKRKVAHNLINSALLPGMGQFSCKKIVKGGLFLGSTIAAFGSAVHFMFQSNDRYKEYKTADNIDDIEKSWNESEKLLQYSRISAGAGAVIWFINIIDAYFTTNSYNKKVFEKFYLGMKDSLLSPSLGLNENRVGIRLVYEF